MGDQDELLGYETAEHVVSTPPPAVSKIGNMLPPRSIRKNRSTVWNHFTLETGSGSNKRARCNYCNTSIKCDNGTSSMLAHSKKCKCNPNIEVDRRRTSGSCSVTNTEGHVASSPSFAKFDQDKCRDDLVRMFVAMELPFRQVENESFQRFCNSLQPRFNVISRTTLMRDVLTMWDMERKKLKNFLSQHCRKVCLTYDTWTSCQNFSYMCLTGHFIDNNWNLHKKILNFCQVTSHSGETMANNIEQCLNGWGLNSILSLTVDNASSNDVGIQVLKKRLMTWNSLVLRGDYIHMRCCAHVLNLIVKEGLKEIGESVLKIRTAVKYVRSSPSRLSKFKKCVERQNIEYKGLVCLDVETRWNSTYLMLEAALKHQKAFEELEARDEKYREELEKGKGLIKDEDWGHARDILPFLKIFYEATLTISRSSYVTSNAYMLEVLGMGNLIKEKCSMSGSIKEMAKRMKRKYDKYWGNPESLNMLLLIAVVLDPRYKLTFVNWLITQVFDYGDTLNLKEKIESCLNTLFDEYSGEMEGFQCSSQGFSQFDASNDRYGFGKFFQTAVFNKSELGKYLEETLEPPGDIDILNWWKLNSGRFPTLSNIARDVLAIPVSTVASESAFSTGGRVLDQYRSSLTPKTVEALICTQDWLKGTPSTLLSNEEFVELEKFEQDIASPHVVSQTASVDLDED